MNYFGKISLTKLWDWARKHPECVKEVRFRDGRTEKMLNIEVLERREPSQFGDVGYIRVKAADGEKAYVADLKKSKYESSQPRAENASMPMPKDVEYLKAAAQSAAVQELQRSFGAEVTGGGKVDDDLPF